MSDDILGCKGEGILLEGIQSICRQSYPQIYKIINRLSSRTQHFNEDCVKHTFLLETEMAKNYVNQFI